MGKLIYAALCSLDGYIADRKGDFSWATPDPELHRVVNTLERSVGTYLYGRKLYEVMSWWETAGQDGELPPAESEYAEIWKAAQKVVYSTTLAHVSTRKTRLEPRFDPEVVRQWKRELGHNLAMGGSQLAGQAFRARLVDEIHLFVNPVIVGGGTKALPDDFAAPLELLHERRYPGGVVHLHYSVGGPL